MIKTESFHIKELKVRKDLLGINASFYGKIAGHPMYWLYCDNKLRSWEWLGYNRELFHLKF